MTTPISNTRRNAMASWARALEATQEEMNRVNRGGEPDRVKTRELRMSLEKARLRMELAPD